MVPFVGVLFFGGEHGLPAGDDDAVLGCGGVCAVDCFHVVGFSGERLVSEGFEQ